MLRLVRMNPAINFNNEHSVIAKEINNEVLDRMLTSEPESIYFLASQSFQRTLSAGVMDFRKSPAILNNSGPAPK